MTRWPNIEFKLRDGCLVCMFYQLHGLKAVRVEKNAEFIAYGEHILLENALKNADEDCVNPHADYREYDKNAKTKQIEALVKQGHVEVSEDIFTLFSDIPFKLDAIFDSVSKEFVVEFYCDAGKGTVSSPENLEDAIQRAYIEVLKHPIS